MRVTQWSCSSWAIGNLFTITLPQWNFLPRAGLSRVTWSWDLTKMRKWSAPLEMAKDIMQCATRGQPLKTTPKIKPKPLFTGMHRELVLGLSTSGKIWRSIARLECCYVGFQQIVYFSNIWEQMSACSAPNVLFKAKHVNRRHLIFQIITTRFFSHAV